MKCKDQIKLIAFKPGIIPSIIKLVIVASLILPISCISTTDQEEITSYIDPTIGNVSRFLVPTYPTFHLPNQMLRMVPQKKGLYIR